MKNIEFPSLHNILLYLKLLAIPYCWLQLRITFLCNTWIPNRTKYHWIQFKDGRARTKRDMYGNWVFDGTKEIFQKETSDFIDDGVPHVPFQDFKKGKQNA